MRPNLFRVTDGFRHLLPENFQQKHRLGKHRFLPYRVPVNSSFICTTIEHYCIDKNSVAEHKEIQLHESGMYNFRTASDSGSPVGFGSP
jgi:hypothetical protein